MRTHSVIYPIRISILSFFFTGILLCLLSYPAAARPFHGQGLQLTATFDNPVVPANTRESRTLEILVTASDGHSGRPYRARRPLNIALVIDKSRSMAQGGKMDDAKLAAIRLLEQLQPGDRFALVAFEPDL